jgi:hypothetical protein
VLNIVSHAGTDNGDQSSNEFNKCISSQPDSWISETICDVSKTVATGGIIWGACIATDALATTIFPPAGALLPLCNVLGFRQLASELAN